MKKKTKLNTTAKDTTKAKDIDTSMEGLFHWLTTGKMPKKG